MSDFYAFERCEVRPTERALLIDGAPVALGVRAFDLLLALIERRDRVVDEAERRGRRCRRRLRRSRRSSAPS